MTRWRALADSGKTRCKSARGRRRAGRRARCLCAVLDYLCLSRPLPPSFFPSLLLPSSVAASIDERQRVLELSDRRQKNSNHGKFV